LAGGDERRIVILHTVKHHCAFQCGLIAVRDVRVLIRDRHQFLADRTPVFLTQPGDSPDHDATLDLHSQNAEVNRQCCKKDSWG